MTSSSPLDSQALPEGSTFFQEVMAELNPHPHLDHSAHLSPATRRRKISSHAKHVHYEEDGVKDDHSQGHGSEGGGEGEEGGGGRGGDGKQILHGKCHCYFVEKGNVTGLADYQCHHEHRHYHSHSHSPTSSSPSTLSPASSPRPSRRAGVVAAPFSPIPHWDGSPKVRSKSHSQLPHPFPQGALNHPHLHLPDPEEFRARSHSDCAARARRLSQGPRETATSTTSSPKTFRGRRATAATSTPQGSAFSPARGSHRRSQDGASPPSDGRRGGDVDRAASMSSRNGEMKEEAPAPLYNYSTPSILLEDASGLSGQDEAEAEAGGKNGKEKPRSRKISSHAVASDQLHYLYEQFLPHGGGPSSASGH